MHESGQSVGFPITAVSRKWKELEVDLCRLAATVVQLHVQCSDELAADGVVLCLSFSFLSTLYQISAKLYGYIMLFISELHGCLEEICPSSVLNIKQRQFQT